LYIIDHLDSGGSQRQIVTLAKSLDRNKYHVTVCNLDKTKKQFQHELEEVGIRIFSLEQHGKFDLHTLLSLYKFIWKNKFDIVHTYLFTADCYGRIAAKIAHTPIIFSSIRSIDNWKNSFHIWTDRILALFTDKIIINANALKKFLTEDEKISPDKITTIYNGLDLKKFDVNVNRTEIKERFNISSNEKVIGIIARNDKLKDHPTFFEAARIVHEKYPQTKFLAIGYGMENENMQKLIRDFDVEKFCILANHSPDIIKIMKILDISVLSSTIEGCSNTILESMALGKPVVATNAGGNPELIINGKTGIIVPKRSPFILAKSVMNLLQNPNVGTNMGKAAKKRIEKYFSIDRMV
ncbi:MAG: glycosyltransferase, partial [Candidatus Cloacimonadota bacterium]|nr:glycosyltransferase [Candidatus Cloacimonadota bacterium]